MFTSLLGCHGFFHHMFAGMQRHLQEGQCHGEYHPDVNHLDVGCGRQGVGDTNEAGI